MNVDDYERLLIALEEIGWIDRVGTRLQVHDWLDYARMYLRDNKFKNRPDKFKEVEKLYENVDADVPQKVRRKSANSPQKVCGTNLTNQPTNQHPCADRLVTRRAVGSPIGFPQIQRIA
jgi:hypothetical protein